MTGYGLADLKRDFGARWDITEEMFLDGWQLVAVPRPPVPDPVRVIRRTPAEMRDGLVAQEGPPYPAGR